MKIAIDFDGTIVGNAYPKIGAPIPFAIEVLRQLQREGHHLLILWTVREGDLLQEAVEYCKRSGLEFYAVNSNYPDEHHGVEARKINADLFIDDKNLGGIPDWRVIHTMLKSGSAGTWNEPAYLPTVSRQPGKKRNFLIRLGEMWEQTKY
jgi:hypothetical protein